MDYQEQIIEHYKKNWRIEPNIYYWHQGPVNELPYDFRVLEFAPTSDRNMWTYATCCMSQANDENRIELHIFSSIQDSSLVELLTSLAFYHRKTASLNLNHTVNFGRPWQDKSNCEYGFISLPYLDGPMLENLQSENYMIKFFWLIPVTKEEVNYKKLMGSEALEERFEDGQLDYLDPNRKSVCNW